MRIEPPCSVYRVGGLSGIRVGVREYTRMLHVRMYVSYVRGILDLNPDPDSPLIPIGSWTSRTD